jgi:ATPase family AAA domain-containing protein 2
MDRGSRHEDTSHQLESPKIVYATTSRGRKVPQKFYRESGSEDDLNMDFDKSGEGDVEPPVTQPNGYDGEDDEDDDTQPQRRRQTRSQSKLNNIIESEDETSINLGRYSKRNNGKQVTSRLPRPTKSKGKKGPSNDRPRRITRRSAREAQQEGDYVDHPSSGSADADGSFEDATRTSSEPEGDAELDAEGELVADADPDGDLEHGPEADGRPYALRQRAKINYAIPPPLEEMKAVKNKSNGGRGGGRNAHGGHGSRGARGPGWSANGAELGRWMGITADDSVSSILL